MRSACQSGSVRRQQNTRANRPTHSAAQASRHIHLDRPAVSWPHLQDRLVRAGPAVEPSQEIAEHLPILGVHQELTPFQVPDAHIQEDAGHPVRVADRSCAIRDHPRAWHGFEEPLPLGRLGAAGGSKPVTLELCTGQFAE